MKLLWLDLNSSYAHSSLALPALHAQIADDEAIEWDIVSATINENVGMVAGEVYRRRPDLLAATVWLFNHEQLLHIISRVKALLPQCCIVLGGPEFLGDNEFFLRSNPFVSCVFRGEGEEVFPQWITHRNNPSEWKNIPGLCYLDSHGNYINNGIARVLDFHHLVPPRKAVSSTGANLSCNWKPHGAASTPAPSASAVEKNPCAPCLSRQSANGCKSSTDTE